MLSLHRLDPAQKILVTMFLVVLSCGFAVSHAYLHFTIDGEDGEENWVPTRQDIALHFHGGKEKTRFKKMIQGPMKKYFSTDEDPEKFTPEERADWEKALAWSDRGAPEEEYWNPQNHQEARAIQSILLNHDCLDCHSPDATRKGNKKDSPLNTYPDIRRFTRPDPGMALSYLLMLSHVHLLGMGLMFLGAGLAMSATRFSTVFRGAVIFAGFASVLIDIAGWWAVKYGGAPYAPLVVLGGLLMGGSFACAVLASLYDLWIKRE